MEELLELIMDFGVARHLEGFYEADGDKKTEEAMRGLSESNLDDIKKKMFELFNR
jgi:hypothetical protein